MRLFLAEAYTLCIESWFKINVDFFSAMNVIKYFQTFYQVNQFFLERASRSGENVKKNENAFFSI